MTDEDSGLCMSFRLCDLVSSTESDAHYIEIHLDSDAEASYDPSSIRHALQTYRKMLDAALQQNLSLADHQVINECDADESMDHLAEEISWQICQEALDELKKRPPASIHQEAHSEMESLEAPHRSNKTVHAPSTSIDYPDAPPTTPLFPEMLRSRASFTRKLQEELAKELLPSPPPPTPKDPMPGSQRSSDFLLKLMHSLSLERGDHQGGEDADDGLQEDRMSELSEDLVGLTSPNEDNYRADVEKLVEKMIKPSLKKLMEEGDQNPGVVDVLATELISHAMSQAFAKLEARVVLGQETRLRKAVTSSLDAQSLRDASRLLSSGHLQGSMRDMEWFIKIRGEERHAAELRCVVLWAAASMTGAVKLHFHLEDQRLQQQLCRLSQSAGQKNWTVAALLASVQQFCEVRGLASRGRCELSDLLLDHLEGVMDPSPVSQSSGALV